MKPTRLFRTIVVFGASLTGAASATEIVATTALLGTACCTPSSSVPFIDMGVGVPFIDASVPNIHLPVDLARPEVDGGQRD
jgi:hypothetical protein